MKKVKQVSILLPADVIKKAELTARRTRRPDGLKQTPTGLLRQWLIKGMEASHATNR